MRMIYFTSSAIGAAAAILVLRLWLGESGFSLGLRNSLILLVLAALFSWLVGNLLRTRFGDR